MSKKIFYIQQQVELNQIIDFNGLKVKVTQELIDNNPNHFYIKDDAYKGINPFENCTYINIDTTRNVPGYVKCINDVPGNILKVNEIYRVAESKCDKIRLHITYKNKPNTFRITNINTFFKYFKPSTEEEYKQQEETKRLDNLLNEIKAKFPIGSNLKINDNVIKVLNSKPTYPVKDVYRVSKDFISVFGCTVSNNTPIYGHYTVYDLKTNKYLAEPFTEDNVRLDYAKKQYAKFNTLESLSKSCIILSGDNTITFEKNKYGDIFIFIQCNDIPTQQSYIFTIYDKLTNTWAKIIN